MENESILAAGFFFERPREGAPAFVKGRLSIQVDKAIAFLEEHKNEKNYVNLDLLTSKENKPYLKLNTWKPAETKVDPIRYPEEDINPKDVPF